MAWIESHTSLLNHNKLVSLSVDFNVDRAHTIGYLHHLWYAVLEQQEDGDLSKWDDTAIAKLAGYTGNAKRFVKLLQKHRFLDDRIIHDWLDYTSKYLISKYSTSNKQLLIDIWAKHGKAYGNLKKPPAGMLAKYDRAELIKAVYEYIRLKGWQIDSKALRNSIIKRNIKVVKELLTFAEDDMSEVYKCMAYTKEYCSANGLNWTLETAVKTFPEYKKPKKAKVRYE